MWGETSAKSGEGISDIFTAIAKKLPQTAAPSSRAGGAARSGAPAGRAPVDLNKQSNVMGGQNEACNC